MERTAQRARQCSLNLQTVNTWSTVHVPIGIRDPEAPAGSGTVGDGAGGCSPKHPQLRLSSLADVLLLHFSFLTY